MDTQGFKTAFETLTGAGVGVILIHTREPHRTQDVLQEVAYAAQRPFKVWDIVSGWAEWSDNPTETPSKTKMPDAFQATARIDDVLGDGKNRWPNGYFVMHYPHWVLKNSHAGLIQLLKQYARTFANSGEGKQRLALLVPEGFVLPVELQNDVMVLDFPLPSREELADSLGMVIDSALAEGAEHEVYTKDQRDTLIRNAAGMTKLEAEAAFAQAVIENKVTWPETPFEKFNAVVLRSKTDVVKRSEVLELMEADSFDSVGGLDLFKEYIAQRKRAFTREARDFGVDVPKGIMLIGPSGTGKSLCAKAIAHELGMPLIRFDVGRCFGSLVGQSEERVRSAMKQLDAIAPCVALADEVDKGLGGAHQAGGDSGVTRRVLGTILTHMQESKAPIYWAFTANRAGALPPELLRKGRLDEVFCVTIPNAVERRAILEIHLRKRKQDPAKVKGLESAVSSSRGYVAAELENAVAEAVNQAFHREIPVTGNLIAEQLRNMKPISVAFKDDFDEMARWAENNARLTSTPEPESAPAVTSRSAPRRRSLEVTK